MGTGVLTPFGLQEAGEVVVYSHPYGHAVHRRQEAVVVIALSLEVEAAAVDPGHDLGHFHFVAEVGAAPAGVGETQVIEDVVLDRTEGCADDENHFLHLKNSRTFPPSTGMVSRMSPVCGSRKLAEQCD